MLMHTKGILVMTPDSAMLLTGKQSLEYSGDLTEVFGPHAAGRTRVSYETRPLAGVNDAISEVLHGKAKARLVLEP